MRFKIPVVFRLLQNAIFRNLVQDLKFVGVIHLSLNDYNFFSLGCLPEPMALVGQGSAVAETLNTESRNLFCEILLFRGNLISLA